jgi:hypothetical protein
MTRERIMKINLTINVPNWLDKILAWPLLIYRQYKFGYTFRRIYVSEGKYAIVDQKDFYWLNTFEWLVKQNNGISYAVRFDNHCDNGPKLLSLHREIMNAPPGLLVDHRNNISLDNRRDNLRLATRSQNNCNKPKRKNAASRFIGVIFLKNRNKWAAQIKYHGKKIWLGCFVNEIDAAKAYDAAARKYHGEFARLNFTP